MSLLSVDNLRVSYGHIDALKGVSLRVECGEVVAILGANGAGKTTLMRALSGLLRPQSGKVTFDGVDIGKQTADSIVKLGIGQSPEGRRVFGTLTVAENLRLGGYTRPGSEVAQSCESVYGIFPRLYERRAQLAGTLSGGEQQMVAIGRALVSKPKLLLLDEPSLGLAPIIIREIFRVLGEIRKTGVTILLVEQNARTALKLADRGYVLEVGKCVLEAPAKELLAAPEMQAAYLGHA
jgi:branched-chain amino acid transport system ATP-binding protein